MLVANEHFWNVPSVIFNATRICESDWISQWLFRSSNTLATIIVLISTIIPMSWVKQWIRYNQMYIRANSSMGVRILSGQIIPPDSSGCWRSGPFHLHLLQLLPPGVFRRMSMVSTFRQSNMASIVSWEIACPMAIPCQNHESRGEYNIDILWPSSRIQRSTHESYVFCFQIYVVDSHDHCEFIVMFICPIPAIYFWLVHACTYASHPLNEHLFPFVWD